MAPKCEPLCCFSDRLYFTTFPHPSPSPQLLNKLAAEPENKPPLRSRLRGAPPASINDSDALYYYFTIDDQLPYLSFFQDWGPLNLAMVYRACILIHELLEDGDLANHRLILYSSDDPKKKANAALLIALYVMIVMRRAPWDAFHPIAELQFMPFRDAGRGPSDFNLNIQDCLWGIWKAMQHNLCDMNEFNVEEYEYYEKVENGDWNWLTPGFIAFASPVDTNWIKSQKENKGSSSSLSQSTSSSSNHALQRKLPTPFQNCLDYFEKRNVKLVVRLNTELYDRTTFLDRGIDHMELYFDDGTNPTDEIVRTFLDVSDKIIESGGAIAVHCKAGLGRTGTLIGAYLIWKYGFTASEAIAFMRIVRPGSVVGPQQQYMYLKQLEWTKWAALDEVKKSSTLRDPTPIAGKVATPVTPPAESDEEMDNQTTPPMNTVSLPPVTPSRHVVVGAAKAGDISPPGQPRKTPKAKRVAQELEEDEEDDILPALGVAPANKKAKTTARTLTSSEQPVRITRSTVDRSNVRRAGPAAACPPESPVKGPRPPPKIPRLAPAARPNTRAAMNSQQPQIRPIRTANPCPSPTPSRLPTLIPSKRNQAMASLGERAKPGGSKKPGTSSDWVANNASAVVVPASKSARPGLRPIRRRRSSFSSADVVARA